MLIKQVHQKSGIFVTNGIFQIKVLSFNRCYDLLMMSINLSDIAILNIKSADYCCFIGGISEMRP